MNGSGRYEPDERNLLLRLQSYQLRPGRNPEEDFFTEAFTHLIISDEVLLRKFVRWLFKDKRIDEKLFDGLRVETQKAQERRKRPDIHIFNDVFSLFVESKIGSKPMPLQLNRYLRIQKKKEKAYLVLITQYEENFSIDKKLAKCWLGHIYWYQVYSFLMAFENKSDARKQFLEFMRGKNMEPFKKIEKNDEDIIKQATKIRENFLKLFNEATDTLEKKFDIHSRKRDYHTNRNTEGVIFRRYKLNKSLFVEIQIDLDNFEILTPAVYLYNVKSEIQEYVLARGFERKQGEKFLVRFFQKSPVFYKKPAHDQKKEIIAFFVQTLNILAGKGLIKKK